MTKKLWETFLGLCGVAVIGIAVWLGFADGIASALIFLVFGAVFIGVVALFVDKIGNVCDKVFSPRR